MQLGDKGEAVGWVKTTNSSVCHLKTQISYQSANNQFIPHHGGNLDQRSEVTLTSPAAAHEAEVVEARHLVLHHTRGVPQLSRVVLVVACHHRDHRPVGYVPQSDHLSEPQTAGILS